MGNSYEDCFGRVAWLWMGHARILRHRRIPVASPFLCPRLCRLPGIHRRIVMTTMSAQDLAYHNSWQPASGHPGGWRVVRGLSPLEELVSKTGRRILFRSQGSAQKRADALNKIFAKALWQVTLAEWRETWGNGQRKAAPGQPEQWYRFRENYTHRQVIERAKRDNKPIPAEVLADYPDLN